MEDRKHPLNIMVSYQKIHQCSTKIENQTIKHRQTKVPSTRPCQCHTSTAQNHKGESSL